MNPASKEGVRAGGPPSSSGRKLMELLGIPLYRRLSGAAAGAYLVFFLVALQDISRGGGEIGFLTVGWSRMFERTGAFTFEPIVQLTLPGLTVLLSPINVLIGLLLSVLVGLNLALTYLAIREPRSCGFNRSTGIVASLPALLAGSACCAPAIVLVLGLQVSSLFMTVFNALIPASAILLLIALKLILDRTDTARLHLLRSGRGADVPGAVPGFRSSGVSSDEVGNWKGPE